MIENNQAIVLWKRCLAFIKDNVNTTAFTTWFEPIVPIKYEGKALTIGVPSPFFYEYLEEKYVDLLRTALYKEIGEGTELMYSIVTDNTNHIDIFTSLCKHLFFLNRANTVFRIEDNNLCIFYICESSHGSFTCIARSSS